MNFYSAPFFCTKYKVVDGQYGSTPCRWSSESITFVNNVFNHEEDGKILAFMDRFPLLPVPLVRCFGPEREVETMPLGS